MTEVTTKQTDYNVIEPPTVSNYVKNSKIYIHTGNIANWTNVKSRRSNDMPANELYQSLYRTVVKWNEANARINKEEVFINCTNAETMDANERGLLKVTAKIFMNTLNRKSIKEAVGVTLKQLGLTSLDSLYLALPQENEDNRASFSESILPLWEEMESLRDAGIATQISSCDLDKDKLKMLVERVRIRPEVNQVNLTSCCHMPEELVKYAKGMLSDLLFKSSKVFV